MSIEPAGNIDLAKVARQVGISPAQVECAVRLLDAGNTLPFITRFRKDQTGGLDERQIGRIQECVNRARQLAERKRTVARSIQAQGKLDPELAQRIEAADSPKRLEDLYFPFRPPRQGLADQARQRGLEPLAEEILAADPACADRTRRAARLVDPERGVTSPEEALAGAGHILAERFSQRLDLRRAVRRIFRRTAQLVSKARQTDGRHAKPPAEYVDFCQPVQKVPPHRVLAINRGGRARILTVKIVADQAAIEGEATSLVVPADHPHAEFLQACVRDALVRLVLPSLERELHREVTERAEAQALEIFARNLRNLLLQAPVRGHRLLAVDPGLKHGCKLAALDPYGRVLAFGLVHVVGSEQRRQESRAKLAAMITDHDLSLVAIGNGAGCREFAELLAALVEQELAGREIAHVVVNAAGASFYSTSALGREELPDCDVTQRSAVSIGRRLLDPLSELVKISPANVGVGLYQHDMRAGHLRDALDTVVRSCVNHVGVDLNTASPSLLRYVSGLNQLTARRLYEYRDEHGPFTSREQLRAVPGIGPSTFVQAAGFLKIDDGENPLDGTWIHPESYGVAERILEKLGRGPVDLKDKETLRELRRRARELDQGPLAAELGVGQYLVRDILDNLQRPGRDPRESLPAVVLHRGVVKMEDLREGMELAGSILNVVDFGAFVDIGLPGSGLVHISQLSAGYVRSPHDVVVVGQRVRVWVTAIDVARRRVALTMVQPGTQRQGRRERAKDERPHRGRPDGQRPAGGAAPRRGHEGRRRARKPAARKTTGHKPKTPSRRPPPIPITQAMEEGREPMRTFGDLLQFHRKQVSEEQPAAHQQDGKARHEDRQTDHQARPAPQQDSPAGSATADQDSTEG